MKYLIFSDSHGSARTMRAALDAHPDAQCVIFLGDGLRDLDTISDLIGARRVIAVRGNCDIDRLEIPLFADFTDSGVHVALCHGHMQGVKFSDARLHRYAGEYDIILHGHTHSARNDTLTVAEHRLTLFNPGAAKNGNYGILTVRENGFLLSHGRVS